MFVLCLHLLLPEGSYNCPQAISDLGIVECREIPEDVHDVKGGEVLLIGWHGSNDVKVTNDFHIFRSRSFPFPLPTRNLGVVDKNDTSVMPSCLIQTG